MIKDIDGKEASVKALNKINRQKCIKCRKHYEGGKAIFVETNSKLMWWHKSKRIGKMTILCTHPLFKTEKRPLASTSF